MNKLKVSEVLSSEHENNLGETTGVFVIKFEPVNKFYQPFLTSSKESINSVIDYLDFAEMIQDKGIDYKVSQRSITFNNKEDAYKAGVVLGELVEEIGDKSDAFDSVHKHNRRAFYGKKQLYKEKLEEVLEKEPTDCYVDSILKSLYAVENRSLSALKKGDKESYNVVRIDLDKGVVHGQLPHHHGTEDHVKIDLEDIEEFKDTALQEVLLFVC